MSLSSRAFHSINFFKEKEEKSVARALWSFSWLAVPKQSQGLSLYPWIGREKAEQGLNFSSLKLPPLFTSCLRGKKKLKNLDLKATGNHPGMEKRKNFAVLSKEIRDKAHSWDGGGIKGGPLGHSEAVGADWMHQKTRGKGQSAVVPWALNRALQQHGTEGAPSPQTPRNPAPHPLQDPRCTAPCRGKTKKGCISLTNGQTHKQKKPKNITETRNRPALHLLQLSRDLTTLPKVYLH